MFTIYIHVLEVLAMHSDGADMCKIGNMGLCFSMVQIQKAVRELEKDGFITRHRTAGGRVYKITEKAVEYCENVTRAYARVHGVNIVDKSVLDADMVAQEAQEPLFTERVTSSEKEGQEGTNEAIVAVSETPISLNNTWVMKDRDNEGNYYTQITGRCEACDELVEHHYSLCDTHLGEELDRIGPDAFEIYSLPTGTIPHLVQRAIDYLMASDNTDDIPF